MRCAQCRAVQCRECRVVRLVCSAVECSKSSTSMSLNLAPRRLGLPCCPPCRLLCRGVEGPLVGVSSRAVFPCRVGERTRTVKVRVSTSTTSGGKKRGIQYKIGYKFGEGLSRGCLPWPGGERGSARRRYPAKCLQVAGYRSISSRVCGSTR